MSPEDQKVFRSKIFEKFKNHSSDAFIIEGYEYGKPLGCEGALRTVFTPDDFLQADSDLAIKYGFMNKIALIPGDNQQIDPKVIYQDITPSIYLAKPLGSNLVVDIHEDLRNRSLLKAIQVSSSVYKKPLALFGHGHLAVLGSSLDEHNLAQIETASES